MGSPNNPFRKVGMPQLLDDVRLQDLARRYDKSVGQLVLRYLVRGSRMSRDFVPMSIGPHAVHLFSDSLICN